MPKIALHGVHENIHAAAGGLKGRQREGQLWIHDGKGRTGHVRFKTALESVFFVGHHCGAAHFAASGGDGDHAADGQAGIGLALGHIVVPHVALVGSAVGNGLGRVDHAAAANSQNKIHALAARQLDALADQRKPGIGNHAAQGDIGQPLPIQRGLDPVHKARTQGALPAVVDQYLAAFAGLDQTAALLLCIFAKDDLCGRVVDKIVHGVLQL